MAKHISKLLDGDELYYLKDSEARANLINKSEKGAASGVATLDATGKVPASQLPSYIDDVINKSEKGVAFGVATLDGTGKVPSSQLPSYVDDVINGYYYNGNFYEEAAHTTEITGEKGKIYVDITTGKSYRWSDSAYILISNPYSVDEEDLTVINNNIKFKDRPNTNGIGRIILRKNIVSGVNTLTQSMINQANTIYTIQYDFTLGGNITVPANCVLEFDGGSIKNATGNTYKVTGNHTTFNLDVSYNIFDDTLGGGFELPYIDLRWIGGISDYNEVNQTGSDNAMYFERAINLIGEYYNGMHINLVGQYYIGTTITTKYDLNITGYHHNSRELLSGSGHSIPTSPSLIVMGANTSFEMIGRAGSGTAKFCNFSIHNIKVTENGSNASFIKCSAAGAPGRVSIVEECEFVGLEHCVYLYADYSDTMLGDLTISKCLAYYCGHVVYATSSSTSVRTLCNCIIKDCNLEQGGSHCIFIEHSYSSIIIDNNILEDQAEPIYINEFTGGVTISNNYTESNTGTVIYAHGSNLSSGVTLKNNYFNEKIKADISYVNLYGDISKFADDSRIAYCKIEDWKHFKIKWIPENIYGSSVMLMNFNKGVTSLGPDSGINPGITDCKGGLVGTKLSSSWKWYSPKTYTDIAICAFVAYGNGLVGFFKSGSGRESDFYGGGNLVIFKQIPYAEGQSNLGLKSNDNAFCSPIIYVTNDTDVSDILIPTIESTLSGSRRPSFDNMPVGYSFFDTSLSTPRIIYYKGNNVWVDATGVAV